MKRAKFLKCFNLTETLFTGQEEIKGSLYLENVTSIPDGFNPTVGRYLDLRSLTSIPEGFNPTVGGSLDLGYNSKHIGANVSKLNLIEFQGGKFVLVDGIFSEVISRKSNIIYAKKYGSNQHFYIVTDGNNNYSHGDTIKEAKEDLIFKIGNRSKDDYKNLTIESKLKFDEAVKCYRVITGACQFGVKDFLYRKEIKNKSFTIQEMITITQNEYGNSEFTKFFTK